jgi:hypothetical protein
VRYAVESAAYGMAFKLSFMTVCSGIQIILMLLSQQFERLGITKYAVEMASGGMRDTPSFLNISARLQMLFGEICI